VARPAFTSSLVALSFSRLTTLSLISLYMLLRDCDKAVNLRQRQRRKCVRLVQKAWKASSPRKLRA
jgi:hypothetical protein